MYATWKKWVCFLVLAAAAGLACHFLAARYLLEPPKPRYAQTNPLMAIVFGARPKDESWAQGVATGMLEHVYLPWPLWPLGSSPPVRTFDPNNPKAADAETIMGLALVGPPWARIRACVVGCSVCFRGFERSMRQLEKETPAWFREMSDLAISQAGDPNTRRQLEGLALCVESAEQWLQERSGPSGQGEQLSAASPTETSLEISSGENSWTKAKEIDPNNAVYFYEQALWILRRLIEERASSEACAAGRCTPSAPKLRDEARLVPTALELDKLLTTAEENAAINTYKAYQLRLWDKAFGFRFPTLGPSARLCSLVFVEMPFVRWPSRSRHLVKQLCFVGDRLAARSQGALALRMYYHAYKLGERLMTTTGENTTALNYIVGVSCATMVNKRLMEYWGRRANAAKVVEAGRFQGYVDRTFHQLAAKSRATRVAPLGGNDTAFIAYLRSAGLTWWFGLSGIAMVAFSLLCACLYMLGRRRRKLSSPSVRLQKGPLLAVTIFPVAAFFGLGLLIPVDFQTMPSASAAALWGLVLTAGWIVAVGLVSRRAAGQARDVRRLPIGWIWPVGGLVTLAVAASAIVWAETPIVTAAVIAWLGTLGCVAIWLIAVLISWAVRKTPADRAYRRAVNKSFAVCTMFVAAVALLATLATIPLTRHHQERYFEDLRTREKDEVRTLMGDDWAKSFHGLDPEVFLLEASPKTQP